jgi:LacI family transcriptional regulator
VPTLSPIFRVLLFVETSAGYGRKILEGIGRYVREHGPWSVFFEERGLEESPPDWLGRWRGDGIISRTATPAMAAALKAKRLPVVELLGDRPDQPSKVHGDNVAGGRMAAEHLLACGLRHFAFFAFGEAWWIELYRDGFLRTLELQRQTCSVYRPPRSNHRLLPHWRDSMERGVVVWLRSLPRPVGIFAPYVHYAARLLDTCRTLNIAVPEEVAVLSAVDDEAICNVTTPPLSTIDWGSERIGYEAAALLARRMAGGPAPQHTLWLPPLAIVTRQSTDVVAIEDKEVAAAVRFIRQRAFQGIGVPHVLEAVGLSRRTLELKFRQHMGHTPKDEILRVQLDRARLLLSKTEMSVETVAQKCGFPSFKNLARLFVRETGMTPRAFRRKHRVWDER